MTPVFPHPDFLVGSAHEKFDETARLNDVPTLERLRRYMSDFVLWVEAQAK